MIDLVVCYFVAGIFIEQAMICRSLTYTMSRGYLDNDLLSYHFIGIVVASVLFWPLAMIFLMVDIAYDDIK